MSALKSGMDRKTARKYLHHPERLSQPRPSRDWRTRVDALAQIWPEAEPRLRAAPELEAKALFEHLLMIRPEQVRETQLRTFQRRVRQWRLEHGPAPEVIFPQTHSPGEVMQLDWTHAKELEISIAGHPLDHLLCQAVLPYSNWQCRVCSHSTIRVKRVTYSVPARFISRRLRVRVYEQHLEVYHGTEQIVRITRVPGRQAVIDYRHVIQALLRKPGAFARYHYREELFPSSTYRRAYDRLVQDHGLGAGELEYLRLLKLTAELGINAVEGLLGEMLCPDTPPWRAATLRGTLCPPSRVELVAPIVDLSVYDAFLREEVAHAA